MRNLRLLIQYDGSAFHGWQIQLGLDTVQGTLTQAIRQVTGEPVHVHGSGRTDAGTHALGQVCNFKTEAKLPPGNFQKALNSLLPTAIRILTLDEVPLEFHSRRDACWKHYRYRILTSRWCSPFEFPYVHHYYRKLDFLALGQMAGRIIGEHDFTSFCDAKTEVECKVRRVFFSFFVFDSSRELIEYNVCANGFLHHMVRNLIGTFLEIARKRVDPVEIDRILEARNRSAAGPTAPSKGLFLCRVGYQSTPCVPETLERTSIPLDG
jgi:tRNA pseudouridine38-40 synthase